MSVFNRLKNISKGQAEISRKDYYHQSWQAGRSKRRKKQSRSLAPVLSTALCLLILLTIAFLHLYKLQFSNSENYVKESEGENISAKQGLEINEAESEEAVVTVSSEKVKGQLTLESKQSEKLIPVYISGAVNKPGVYYLEEGSLLLDLLELADGLSSVAAPHQLNLAAELSPNSHIHFPTKEEFRNGWQDEKAASVQFNPYMGEGVVSGGDSLIDLNTCTREDLLQVKGIGEVLAGEILDYRQSLNRCMTKEDLLQVRGIAEKKYSSIEPYFK